MYSDTRRDESFVPDGPGAGDRRIPSADDFAETPAPRRDDLQSPALRRWVPGQHPACEMKFLLEAALARQVEDHLSSRMLPDPHAEPALDGAYRVSTLYCDTPDFQVFHRQGRHRRRKYRLRRYGASPQVFLERKSRRGDQVWKHRSVVEISQVPWLAPFRTPEEWAGEWFHHQLAQRQLQPVCWLEYLRTAYVGAAAGVPLRLTFDRAIQGKPHSEWSFAVDEIGEPLLAGLVVCEFKFMGALPALFKEVIHDLRLAPSGASKYRRCIESCGLARSRSDSHA